MPQLGHCSRTNPCAKSHARSLPLTSCLATQSTRSLHVARTSLCTQKASQPIVWLASTKGICNITGACGRVVVVVVLVDFVDVVASVVVVVATVVASVVARVVMVALVIPVVLHSCGESSAAGNVSDKVQPRSASVASGREQVSHTSHWLCTRSWASPQPPPALSAKVFLAAHTIRSEHEAPWP